MTDAFAQMSESNYGLNSGSGSLGWDWGQKWVWHLPQLPCVVSSWLNSDSSSGMANSSCGPAFCCSPYWDRISHSFRGSPRLAGEQEPRNEWSSLLPSSKCLWVTFDTLLKRSRHHQQ